MKNKTGLIYALFYIILIVCANYTAQTIINFYWLSFGLGTLFFGGIFTLRDRIHIELGRKNVYYIIAIAIFVNAICSLSGGFSLRIFTASLIGMLLSEIIDTEIFHKMRNHSFVLRVLTSNSVSVIVDTILFTCIAFYGLWSNDLLIRVIIGNSLIKYIFSILFLLFTPKIKESI